MTYRFQWRRLIRFVLFFPVLFLTVFIQIPFYLLFVSDTNSWTFWIEQLVDLND